MKRMRLLWLKPKRTAEALATEEAILRLRLEGKSPSTLCFWRGEKCLNLGFNPVREKVNFPLCEELGIPVCRRQSGGGVIYQESGNLNYSLIAKKGELSLSNGFRSIGEAIDSAVVSALRAIGLDARLMAKGGAEVNGKKISGSAQFMLWDSFIHHGVIAVDTNVEVIYELLPLSKVKVTTVERELGRRVNFEELADKIINEFARALGVEFCLGVVADEEVSLANELLRLKYLSCEWTRVDKCQKLEWNSS
jgi:lipoate-protein ligase A